MVDENHYDDESLTKLLRNRMGVGATHTLKHVESCETCQSKLDRLCRDGMTWNDVQALLTPGSDPLAESAQDDLGRFRDSSASMASFLEASEYPESLGRFSRFEIMEILGRGGMGVVMRGYDTALNRYSAVKVLAPEFASNAAARMRFSREARSAAAVVHPHVVPIQTVDDYAGLPFLVMPVVEGKSVEARVADSGPLQVIEAVRIAAQIADGLSAAHAKGLVHRDVKPANVLLENGVERVQITDFGLARAVDDASMTRSGVISGTPQYMSPEQAHGDGIDHRSDLFSLGSLIYFMLTGRSPFRAETTMGVLNRIGNDQPRTIRSINADVPQWLEGIATKLLEKEPADRYQTAREVAELLDRWVAHLQQPDIVPPPQSVLEDNTVGIRRPPVWLVAVVAAVLAILALPLALQKDRTSASTASNESDRQRAPATSSENRAEPMPLTGLRSGQRELWRAPLGTMTMRAPVVHGDLIFAGTNNGHGYVDRYPSSVDLGVLLCFRKSDGKFLWQHSNRKLATGRIHDWPQCGITSRPCAEGDRLWYVTNRAEIVCLDTQGFRDGQNDGSVQDEESTDLTDADVNWRFDLIDKLGVSPHNVSTCEIALWKNYIFAVTGTGVFASHQPRLAGAPSFIALDKRNGKLIWKDDSPGQNVLHGQWGSPTVIELEGETQIIFPGGDGWLYSFAPEGAGNGRGKLNWKFDCNPKESIWKLGVGGTRNNLLHGPTLHDGNLFIAMGQDPEHGGGQGRLWCIDPAGSGDVSPQLVYNKENPETPIAHRREQACVSGEGDFTLPNPNSKAIWEFAQQDVDEDGAVAIDERMSRSLSTIAISGDLLFVSDIEGILHCIDRHTGKQLWGFDTFSNVYSTPVIVGDRVYLGTNDGEILVLGCSADLGIAAPNGEPLQRIDCRSSVNASVVADGNVLFLTSQEELIAIEMPEGE